MKKLFIVFDDGSKITYTIKGAPWEPYFYRHNRSSMKSAILQQYPKKDNAPINLLNNESEEK